MYGIGDRLKLARKMARLSQQELADRTGVSKMAISKYENDQMMPGSEILSTLAEILGIRMEFLLRQAPVLEFVPVYRKHGVMPEKSEEALIATIQDWLERYVAVEAFFPLDDRDVFAWPSGSKYRVESLEDAERAATALRQKWNLGTEPVENLTELLEARGIKVGLVSSDKEFIACTFWVNDDLPVIASNAIGPGDRQRFGLAHELGHLVMNVLPELEEGAANRFAGAFLVHAEAAIKELGRSRNTLDPIELYLLKHRYGMSMGAWLHRAEELGILRPRDAQHLWQQFVQQGWKEHEPADQIEIEYPGRMHRLVRRLVAEDIISRSRAAELLGNRINLFTKKEQEALEVRS